MTANETSSTAASSAPPGRWPEVLAVFLAVLITNQIASDGESNWLEGVLLLAVYFIVAFVFFFLPDTEHPA